MKFNSDETNHEPNGEATLSERDKLSRAFAVAHLERWQRFNGRRAAPSSFLTMGPAHGRTGRFARAINTRLARTLGAASGSFLASSFGARFESTQGAGFPRERVYRGPGRFSRNTFHKSVAELFMSINFSRLIGCAPVLFEPWRESKIVAAERWRLNNGIESRGEPKPAILTTQTLLTHSLTRLWAIRERPARQGRSAGHQPASARHLAPEAGFWSHSLAVRDLLLRHVRPNREAAAPRGSKTSMALRIIERVFARGEFKDRKVTAEFRDLRTPVLTRLFRKGSRADSSVPEVAGARRPWEARFTRLGADRLIQRSSPALFGRQLTAVASSDVNRRRREAVWSSIEPSTILQPQRFFSFSSFNRLTRSNRWSGFNQARTLSFVRAICSPIKTISMRSVFSSAGNRLREMIQMSQTAGPAESSTRAAGDWESRQLRFGLRRLSFAAAGDRHLVLGGGLAQQAVRAPTLSADMVFAERGRQEKSDDEADRRFRTREITEQVRKELKETLTKEGALARFTHDDYAEITDQVYSSLVRRLTVERERLGWR